MVTWLHQFNNVTIFLVVVLGVTFPMALAPWIGSRLLRLDVNDTLDDAVVGAFSSIIAVLGIVLAFSLVEANGALSNAQQMIVRQGAALQDLDRELLRSNFPPMEDLRPLVGKLGASILNDEFPLLSKPARSKATDAALDELNRAMQQIEPSGEREKDSYDEAAKHLDTISDIREGLESAADPAQSGLPGYYWTMIGMFLLLCFVVALVARGNAMRMMTLGAQAMAAGMLLAFLVVIDEPFRGQTSVNTQPLKTALEANASRK